MGAVAGRAGCDAASARPAPGLQPPPPSPCRPPPSTPHPRAGNQASACASRPAHQFTAAPRLEHTRALAVNPRSNELSNAPHYLPVIERETSRSRQDSFASGNALEYVRGPERRGQSGGGPASFPIGAGVEHAESRGADASRSAGQSAGLRAAARRPRQEEPEHDGVRSGAFLRTRRGDRRQTRFVPVPSIYHN